MEEFCDKINYKDLTKLALDAELKFKNDIENFFIRQSVLDKSKVHLSSPKDYNNYVKKLLYLNDPGVEERIVNLNKSGVKSSLYCSLCSSIAFNKRSLESDERPDRKQIDFYEYVLGGDCYTNGLFYLRQQEESAYHGHLLVNSVDHVENEALFLSLIHI